MEKMFSLRVGPAVFVEDDGYLVEGGWPPWLASCSLVLPVEVAPAMHVTSV